MADLASQKFRKIFQVPLKILFSKSCNFFEKVKRYDAKIQGFIKIFKKFFIVYFLWPLENSISLYGHISRKNFATT